MPIRYNRKKYLLQFRTLVEKVYQIYFLTCQIEEKGKKLISVAIFGGLFLQEAFPDIFPYFGDLNSNFHIGCTSRKHSVYKSTLEKVDNTKST